MLVLLSRYKIYLKYSIFFEFVIANEKWQLIRCCFIKLSSLIVIIHNEKKCVFVYALWKVCCFSDRLAHLCLSACLVWNSVYTSTLTALSLPFVKLQWIYMHGCIRKQHHASQSSLVNQSFFLLSSFTIYFFIHSILYGPLLS